MIPIRDHNPTSSFPFVTYGLIAANVSIFALMLSMPQQSLESFIETWALQPNEIFAGTNLITIFTSMFLHGGIGHIVGNMLFLNIFGDNLEDLLGHVRYLLYYLVCGIGAAALQIFIDPTTSVPMLGASGAIAGLLGGYLIKFPKHKVDVLFPIGFVYSQHTVPAYTMLFYWILTQFVAGFGSLGVQVGGGVAFFAHIGGFITGLLLILGV